MGYGREWLSAGLGCAIADGIFNPLEVLKVKLQLQQGTSVYPHGLVGTVRQVVREDGYWRGLQEPGLAPTVLRSMTYVGFRIGLYPSVRGMVQERLQVGAGAGAGGTEALLATKIAAGTITGGVGSAVFCPIDVVRVRAQADAGRLGADGRLTTGLRRGRAPRYRGTVSAFGDIVRSEGPRGLWRGASATIARAAILSGSQLASYDSLKQGVKRHGLLDEGVPLHMVCSLVSGLIAQTCIMPVDTARSCLMGGEGGSWRQVLASVREHGPRFLYRGYIPACARQGPVMLVQMPLVEQFRRLFGLDAF